MRGREAFGISVQPPRALPAAAPEEARVRGTSSGWRPGVWRSGSGSGDAGARHCVRDRGVEAAEVLGPRPGAGAGLGALGGRPAGGLQRTRGVVPGRRPGTVRSFAAGTKSRPEEFLRRSLKVISSREVGEVTGGGEVVDSESPQGRGRSCRTGKRVSLLAGSSEKRLGVGRRDITEEFHYITAH